MSQAEVIYDNIPLLNIAQANTNYMIEVDSQKAVAEVQASLIIAKRFPRDEVEAVRRIKTACQRQGLAEKAMYNYARGGTTISGPSIRLAEVMANAWGNLDCGYRVLETRAQETICEAYAWDKETNTRQVKQFVVQHVRDTKQGKKNLTDARDIYEIIANNASRRIRACIMAIIPYDIQEDAIEECRTTLKTKVKLTPEKIKAMVKDFETLGVNKKMLEKRIQRSIDSIEPAQFINLFNIYNSIIDKIGEVADFFDIAEQDTNQSNQTINKTGMEGLKAKIKKEEPTLAPEPDTKQSEELADKPIKSFISCPKLEGQEDAEIYVENCKSCKDRTGCPSWE